MDLKQAITERHSVRQYTNQKLKKEPAAALRAEIDACNTEGGLHMQLVTDEPKAFSSFLAHYGKFNGVGNYIALAGRRSDSLDERLGYYGERIALLAQTLGLNTCWVAATFGKSAVKKSCEIGQDEKLVCVLALGYGATQGVPHTSKPMKGLYKAARELPGWFQTGMETALLAPTAMNQQKFLFTLLADHAVKAESTGGPYSKVDLGIVKLHFEIGAGKENFRWA